MKRFSSFVVAIFIAADMSLTGASAVQASTTTAVVQSGHKVPGANSKTSVRPLTGCVSNCHHYAGYQQTSPPATLSGIYDGKDVQNPAVTGGDSFSLEETAILDSLTPSTANIVEVGWMVSPSIYGDTHTHLWVGYWINGSFQGFNPSGFVKCTKVSPFNCGIAAIGWPGDDLSSVVTSPPTLMRFGIEHTGTVGSGQWFVTYGTAFVGYFPDTLWPAGTNWGTIKFFENFGEVLSPGATACSQMGDGTFATSSTGPRDATLTYNISSPVPTYSGAVITDPTVYNAVYSGTSTRTFRYGGDNPAC